MVKSEVSWNVAVGVRKITGSTNFIVLDTIPGRAAAGANTNELNYLRYQRFK